MDKAIVSRADEALTYSTSPTEAMSFLFPGDDDMPDVMRETMEPGDGPPLHSHPWATWEVVVRGRLRIVAGDDTFEAGPGDGFYTPPDMVHTFMAIGDEPAEVVAINWPGGFHKLYGEMSEIMTGTDGPPDFAAMSEAAARHGATLHGPPLAVMEAS